MTGAQLIADERREQIMLHKRTVKKDVLYNVKNELTKGATRLLFQVQGVSLDDDLLPAWPDHWDNKICEKMDAKTDFEKVQIAGALLAADLDRRMATGCGPGKAYDELTQAARPLMEYLANHYHPHTIAIVTNTNAQVYESQENTGDIMDYVKD
jgi:hypothetical protein